MVRTMKTESGREIFWATDVFSRDGETCRFVMDSGGPSLIIGSSKVAKSELPSVEEEQVAVLEEKRGEGCRQTAGSLPRRFPRVLPPPLRK